MAKKKASTKTEKVDGTFYGYGTGVKRKKTPPKGRAGTHGTGVFGGYPETLETHGDLTGANRYKNLSDTLINVSIVSAGVRYFLNLCAKPSWKLKAAKTETEQDRAEEIKEKTEKIIKDIKTPWARVIRRAAMYRIWGFSIQEWIAIDREDGLNGLLDVEPRPQRTIERWDIMPGSGEVRGVVQRSAQTGQDLYIDRAKMVYLVDDSLNDSPEGLGLLRHIAEPAKRLKRFHELEVWGYETDLRGIPIGRAPLANLKAAVKKGDIDQSEMDRLITGLKGFMDTHVRTPSLSLMLDSLTYSTTDEKASPSNVYMWGLDIIKGQSHNLAEIAKAIQRLNREIARIIGVESILLGETGSGSLAMARDKSEVFALIVDSTIKEITEVFNKDIIGTIGTLNGWPKELLPTFAPDKVQQRSISEITQALRDLAEAGAVFDPDDPAIAEVMDMLGLTKPNIMSDPQRLKERRIDEALISDKQDPPAVPQAVNDNTDNPAKKKGNE